ncbi:MAG TPA: hypothetical protein VF271_06455 [Rhodanobacteraceae bacterium]
MIKTLRLTALVAITVLLAACSRGQDITFDGFSVSLHAAHAPTATITSRGGFSVGSKVIDTTPAQTQLLLRYYNRVTAIHADTEALKKAGLHMAGEGLKAAGQSIQQAIGVGHAGSTARATAQNMQSGGNQMQNRANKLCREVSEAQALQATLGTEVPAFKPYAGIDPAPDVHC